MDPSHQQWMQAHQHQQAWAAGPTTFAASAAATATTTAPSSYHQPTSIDDIRTLWIGDLQYWVDENYLHNCFAHTGEVLSIKVIRNKVTGLPEGYGFVEFVSHAAAERILQTYNGLQMPGTEQTFRLNWASFGIGERRGEGPDHSIFVGDLAPDVTDYLLQETFRSQYPSVRGAKVVTDPNTGRSKGYGFVKFADEIERNRAMTEMNGVYCSTRPMRISAATPKKTIGIQQAYTTVKGVASGSFSSETAFPAPAFVSPQLPPVLPDNDITNTTIFVGGLDPNVAEVELGQIFAQFGELIYVKIPSGKGCGFVQFAARTSAEEAIQRVHGTMIGQQIVRLSWGRSPTSKQPSTEMIRSKRQRAEVDSRSLKKAKGQTKKLASKKARPTTARLEAPREVHTVETDAENGLLWPASFAKQKEVSRPEEREPPCSEEDVRASPAVRSTPTPPGGLTRGADQPSSTAVVVDLDDQMLQNEDSPYTSGTTATESEMLHVRICSLEAELTLLQFGKIRAIEAELLAIRRMCEESCSTKSRPSDDAPAEPLPTAPDQPSFSRGVHETSPAANPPVSSSTITEMALQASHSYGVGILDAVNASLRDIRRDVVDAMDRIERANGAINRALLQEDYCDHEGWIRRLIASDCFLWSGASHDFLVSYVGIAHTTRLEAEFNAQSPRPE